MRLPHGVRLTESGTHLTAPIFGSVVATGIELCDLAFGDPITPLLSGHIDVAAVRSLTPGEKLPP